MTLSVETKTKLEKIKNRATTYEVAVKLGFLSPAGAKTLLVGYCPKSFSALLGLSRDLADYIVPLAGTRVIENKDRGAKTFNLGKNTKVYFTGRTKRAAIIEGELDWVGDVSPTEDGFGIAVERENDRSKVMAYMYRNGEDHWRLTWQQWEEIYLLADGFGKIDRAKAVEQCFDWSHVRDSSPDGIRRMWDAICTLHNDGKLKTTGGAA